MNHIVLVNIENDTEKVKRQFSPPFGLLIAASILLRNNVDVIVRHIINTKETIEEFMSVCKGALAVGFSVMTSPNILTAVEASKRLHEQGTFVYWAGTHATLLPEETPNNLDATLSLIEELGNYPNIKIDGPKCYNPYPGTEFFQRVIAEGWKIPKTNEEWAKYNRSISISEAGFNISQEHIKILQKHKIL